MKGLGPMGREFIDASHPRLTDALLTVARAAWWLAAALVVLGGAAVALFTMPPAALGLVVGCAAVLRGVNLVSSRGPERPTGRQPRVHGAAATPWVAAGAVVVAVGVLTVTGSSGLVLLALLVATSPPAVARYCVLVPDLVPLHVLLRQARSPGTGGTPRTAVISLTSLSTEQLCRAWRHSSSTLGRARTVAERTAATTIRAGYLDELERRDPAGFSAWIAMSPRPGSDPARYVMRAPDRRRGWRLLRHWMARG